MILDTSAVMVLLLEEPEQEAFVRILAADPMRNISAGTWIELAVVLSRRGDPTLSASLEALLAEFPIAIVPMSVEQAQIGADAYRRYGKGNHPARLNFGDCFAYALARATGEPLLYKGEDFARTDIAAAA